MAKEARLSFKAGGAEMKAFISWWQGLDESRGDRAELRRCSELGEIVLLAGYHRLRRSVVDCGRVNDPALATVAGLAAHVKQDMGAHSLAEQMAQPRGTGGGATVSGLRFRRLLKIKRREELFLAMVRVVRHLGGAVNLQSLASSMYWWNDSTRKQWALDYYSAAPNES